MSFEGRYQILCEKGHYSQVDVHMDIDYREWRCSVPACGSEIAWSNTIDETNCLPYPDNCEIKLKEKTPAIVCTCSCGNRHVKEPATYHIPTEQGLRGGILVW